MLVRHLGLIVCLVLGMTLPFCDKAIHLDDAYFVEVAQNIRKDPWRPFAGAAALEDIDYRVFAARGECPSTFEAMSHPPLVPYAIAAVSAVTGGIHERALHVAFALFTLLAAAAMYGLSQRFTDHPLEATLFLVSTPIFLLGAQTLMTDMPALALSSSGLFLFVRGIDAKRRAEVGAAGLLVGLAVLSRYSTIAMIPLLLAYAYARGRLRAALPALGLISLVLAAWAAQNIVLHGTLHVLASTRHYRQFFAGQSFDVLGLVKKTLADGTALGGTSFVAAGLLLLAGRRRRALTFVVAALAAATVFDLRPRGIERFPTYSAWEVLAVSLCFGGGILLVAEALWSARADAGPGPAAGRRGDASFLVLWLGLAYLGAILFLPFGAARYVLPALPPLVILLVRRWWPASGASRWARLPAALIVVQGLCLSAVLGVCDTEAADLYRRVALEVRHDHPARRIWFVGEWGFRYYMKTVGGVYLRSQDESPDTGDLVVRPFIAGMHEISPDVRRRAVRTRELPLPSRWPIRLMSFEAKAGYYSHHWGYLPWSISRSPLETIEIFEVRAPAPPPAPDPCASS